MELDFDKLASFELPDRRLDLVDLGYSGFAGLVFHCGELPSPIMLSLSAAEMKDLRRMIARAAGTLETQTDGPAEIIGQLAPKPIRLRVLSLARQHPMLLLYLSHGKFRFPFPVEKKQVEDFLKIVSYAIPHEPAPPLEGDIVSATAAVVAIRKAGETKEFKVMAPTTQVLGPFGEFRQVEELVSGDVVRLYAGGAHPDLCLRLEMVREGEPPPSATDQTTALGERADSLVAAGHLDEGRETYHRTLEMMIDARDVNLNYVGKIALGLIYSHLNEEESRPAAEIWHGRTGNPLLDAAVKQVLDAGSLNDFDLMLYRLLSAELHSLGPPAQAEPNVNKLMQNLTEEALKADPQLVPLLLKNWYLNLQEIYEGRPPNSALTAWKALCGRQPRPILPKVLQYPKPGPWALEFGGEEIRLEPEPVAQPVGGEKKTFWQRLFRR
ncbi:MAG: hypothetical protein AB7S38_19875 [Vulcanimicrobiota bacterium]